MTPVLRVFLLFITCSLPLAASAEWVQGESTLAVKDAPLDDVRLMAIKNAIADASFKAGSLITAEDVVLNGLLVSSKAEIHSTGRIQRVEILSETVEDEKLTVVVRVNITPIFSCESDKYSRTVLVTRFQLLKPRQAAYGDIYDFGQQISKRIEQQLMRQETSLSVQLMDKAFADTASFNALQPQMMYEKAAYLAQTSGRQFIVFGFVRDISLFEQINIEDDDDAALKRNFTLDVYVIDAFRNALLLQDSYHSEANWSYAEASAVDTHNSLFWRSEYGRVSLNTVNAAVSDISSAIACKASITQIVDKLPDGIVVAMGSDQGVSMGDSFSLLKKRSLKRTPYTGISVQRPVENVRFTVSEVNAGASVLTSDRPADIALAELYDLVTPADTPLANSLSQQTP
ncbi:flagellar assembly protein T N-terminal domain-containing protein [Alteromonas sp. C1M14]|uniref:flagellar assembly protein T N-terminal domain-containing protein n=1 Tax=Alteromonas sp. C1M14 TaxID=2841567 RepID=UPI001C0807E8|nr:flagellar assembly protein T N-terminal domain-containing protein [Alteromonas sp. C1M14]MBU2980106.1 flagellar assembly protein T N-terminal domain-containing protein [Alteromonas sp. C1M14]